jgi:hypothetical protein
VGVSEARRLQEDDPVLFGTSAGRQGLEDQLAWSRELVTKGACALVEQPPVRPEVGYRKNHIANGWVIPLLERDPSLERLYVSNSGFRFDRGTVAGRIEDYRVPGSLVAGNRDRRLEAPPQFGRRPGPKPLYQRQLRSVSQRRSAGLCPSCQVQANHRHEPGQLDDGGCLVAPAFDATDGSLRCSRRAGNDCLAEPSIESGIVEFLAELANGRAARLEAETSSRSVAGIGQCLLRAIV